MQFLTTLYIECNKFANQELIDCLLNQNQLRVLVLIYIKKERPMQKKKNTKRQSTLATFKGQL